STRSNNFLEKCTQRCRTLHEKNSTSKRSWKKIQKPLKKCCASKQKSGNSTKLSKRSSMFLRKDESSFLTSKNWKRTSWTSSRPRLIFPTSSSGDWPSFQPLKTSWKSNGKYHWKSNAYKKS